MNFEAPVLIQVGDDVSTVDMAPDGAIAMSVWSNIPACAQSMFSRLDPTFHERAIESAGGIIVADDDYGQGSSREHAALIPLHLGVRAIVARSYARIHRRNSIAAGVVPLVMTEARDVRVGERWSMPGLAQAVAAGAEAVAVVPDGARASFDQKLDLTRGEREMLTAGGLSSLIRNSGRTPVQAR